tara:strand:- start:512 stop:3547 length:3036 start_codon:yes stop_codon:yes gene_type:complete
MSNTEPTIEQIRAFADLNYAAQTTGVSSAVLNAAVEAIGIDTSQTFFMSEVNELLSSYGYAAGSASGFYENATTGQTRPDDAGLAIHYDAVETAMNEYGYLQSTEANIAEYGGKIDPTTGELYKFMVNDNLANAQLIQDGLASQGLDTSSTVAILPGTTASSVEAAQNKYTEEYDRQNEMLGGDLDNSLQWANIDRLPKVTSTTNTTGTGVTGVTNTGTTSTGSGGISGGFTADPDTLDIPDSAVLPTFTNGVSQVSPGASGTYTVPAQTFEDNITNQVEDFKTRAVEQQEFYQPQTVAEKQAAGEDVSSYALSQKLYRNPQTGHQLFISFQGNQPLQAIPAGYYEVNQQTGTMGTGVFNPITAGGNTFTGANSGGVIQGYAGEDGSVVTGSANPINPNQIYGNVSFQDPVTGQVITQTPAEYYQSLGNKQAQATFNPATSVAMSGVSTMAELGYEYNADGTVKLDPATGQPMMKELMPGTVLESTAGQAQALAPVITGQQIAQVGDIVQAKGPGTPAIYDEAGNLLSAAVEIPGAGQVGLTTAAPGISTQLEGLTPVTSTGPTQTITGQTQDTTSVSGLTAETGTAQTVADVSDVPTRTLQTGPNGEVITGTGVDQAAVQQAFGTGEVAAASVQDELAGLMAQFEGGDTPAWAAGSMRKASQMLAARGLGASSLAGQAVIQAAMEAALPIAQIDAGNKQQMALFKAEQRAKFLGQEFDQAFQAKVQNAARVSEIANMNFSAEQQVALENSRAANTMDLQNLNNKQALIMSEAAALSQLDMASLSNLQQAQVQNAQNFLQIDMANLNNSQSTALFKAQQVSNAMLSDAAQANASAQFNATSTNQTNQFFSNLSAQVSQFNAAQQNAINQFNAEEANAVLEFNSALQNQREMFNAQNYLAVAQANAQWRQGINTKNTEAQNIANLTYAKEVNGLTQKSLDDYWQKERDIMSYAFAQSEGSADRALRILLGEMDLEGIRTKFDFEEDKAKSAFWSDLLFGDTSFSDVFKMGGA